MDTKLFYKKMTFGKAVDNCSTDDLIVKVGGYNEKPFVKNGTVLFFNQNDNGVLTNLKNGSPVFISKTDKVKEEETEWVVVSKKEMLKLLLELVADDEIENLLVQDLLLKGWASKDEN